MWYVNVAKATSFICTTLENKYIEKVPYDT
jgi:hypothetical protein